MPDLELNGFDSTTIGEAVRQPPLDSLRQRAAARQRRRLVAVSTSMVAVIAVSLLAPMMIGRPGGDLAAPVPPSPGEVEERSVSRLFVLGPTTSVGIEINDNCMIRFTRTTDGGQNWSPWHGPADPGPCQVDDGGRVLSELDGYALSATVYLASVDRRALLSTDAGLTWRAADSVIETVDSFPPDATVVNCARGCPGLPLPIAVDADTGTVFRLRNYPSNLPSPLEMYVAPDGALWATGWTKANKSVVLRSIDRGASWQTTELPVDTIAFTVAARNQREAFILFGPVPWKADGTQPGQIRLRRTSDGGRTWQEVPTDLPGSGEQLLTIGSDGSLLVGDRDPGNSFVWISRDGGTHFTRGSSVPGSGMGAGPGRIWTSGSNDSYGPARVTTDGEHWTPIPLPVS